MKKVLVTGANGQLGQCIKDAVNQINNSEYQYTFVTRQEFDLANIQMMRDYLTQNELDVLINCAAYTAVDLAEEEVDKAYAVNAEAVGEMAKICAEKNIEFIHVSTDYVFDGNADKPFAVDHETNPISVYGKSKLVGEQLAVKNNPESIIIRTAWVYSQHGKNFMKTMLRLFADKDEISVVNDQKGTPTNANDIARAILKVVQAKKKTPGIYHFTNAGDTTWFGFAEAIKELTNAEIKINPIPTSQFPTPAKRPAYSVLDTAKIQEVYDVDCPHWKDSLKLLFNKLSN